MICTLFAGRAIPSWPHRETLGRPKTYLIRPLLCARVESIFSIAPKIFPGAGQWNGTSRIGLATSEDGLHFTRDAEPIVSPSEDYELPGGCEDPRVVEAEGRYWLTYTGYDGANARLCLASSADLKTWEKHGVLFPELEWSKSGAILDVPIDGQHLMYFGDTHLWLARSTDLVRWQLDPKPVLSPREGLFDSRLVEPGPPPLLTDEGIL